MHGYQHETQIKAKPKTKEDAFGCFFCCNNPNCEQKPPIQHHYRATFFNTSRHIIISVTGGSSPTPALPLARRYRWTNGAEATEASCSSSGWGGTVHAAHPSSLQPLSAAAGRGPRPEPGRRCTNLCPLDFLFYKLLCLEEV